MQVRIFHLWRTTAAKEQCMVEVIDRMDGFFTARYRRQDQYGQHHPLEERRMANCEGACEYARDRLLTETYGEWCLRPDPIEQLTGVDRAVAELECDLARADYLPNRMNAADEKRAIQARMDALKVSGDGLSSTLAKFTEAV
jgi:hypothetical protein